MPILRKPIALGHDTSVIAPAGVPPALGQDTTVTDTGTTTFFGPSTTDTSASASAPTAPSGGSDWLSNITSALTSVTGAVAQTVQAVAPAATTLIQQAQFNSVNAQRAAKGLSPLTAAQYQTTYGAPTATFGVGLTPQTTQTAYIALGVIAAAVLGFAVLRK